MQVRTAMQRHMQAEQLRRQACRHTCNRTLASENKHTDGACRSENIHKVPCKNAAHGGDTCYQAHSRGWCTQRHIAQCHLQHTLNVNIELYYHRKQTKTLLRPSEYLLIYLERMNCMYHKNHFEVHVNAPRNNKIISRIGLLPPANPPSQLQVSS
jgi:hypothetical protein